MLTDEDFELFKTFRVRAMGEKAREICEDASYDDMTFEERLKLMLDAEAEARRSRKVEKLVREARFKLPGACVEELLYLPGRKLHKDRVLRWAKCDWVDDCEVMVIISKTGCGKSYLSQALGVAACRTMHTVRYTRLADMCADLNEARATAAKSYYERIALYKSVELLIIDDFLTTPVTATNSVDLFEVIEARDQRRATMICSQLEPEEWYLRIEGEVMADSILSRLASTSRFVDLEGPNMRKHLAKQGSRAE